MNYFISCNFIATLPNRKKIHCGFMFDLPGYPKVPPGISKNNLRS